MKIVIATLKQWNIEKAQDFKNKSKNDEVVLITQRDGMTLDHMSNINPDYIFFPHWSYIISEDIFLNFNCIVFHMTDLPYGRGGSPLQNLIERGYKETKISAIKVVRELDAGPVYMKYPLKLDGSAHDIFCNASDIIFDVMIPKIVNDNIIPVKQEGKPVLFKRRTPEQSCLHEDYSIEKIYDYIRMLDAEGYPSAFIDYGSHRLKFDSAEYDGKKIIARVEICKRE